MKIENIFKKSLGINKKDNVLLITDNKKLKITKKFYKSLKKVSNNVSLLVKGVGKYHGEEPSKKVSNKMKNNDVVIAVTTHSLTHTNARRNACKKGTRIVTMPGFTEKMLPTLKANPMKMLKTGKKIEKLLRKTKTVRITTQYGTDISFSVKGRFIDIDAGIFNKPGNFGNMPSGEVSTSPKEGTANGIIVINSMENFVKPNTTVYVEKGRAVGITDKKSKLSKIFKKVKNSINIAEFGIGLNPKAKIIGNILQDEKTFKTCHIAFGNNKSYKGKVYSKVHLDAIILKPTIWFDKKKIMSKGKLKI
jgi:leucyl aminopeptidase (aminopeptidase T)